MKSSALKPKLKSQMWTIAIIKRFYIIWATNFIDIFN